MALWLARPVRHALSVHRTASHSFAQELPVGFPTWAQVEPLDVSCHMYMYMYMYMCMYMYMYHLVHVTCA